MTDKIEKELTDRGINPKHWSNLPAWDDLPSNMRLPEIKPYYDSLDKKRNSLMAKRIFDVVVASALLIILIIPMGIISILIKADSPGPLMYRQIRITTYGHRFSIHKFRTMIDKADQRGTSVTIADDSRITKIGGKLRRTRLDELPQLFDVLAGNMSFVGTRPEIEKYVIKYTPEMRATLLLPAGVTSEASIKYKDEDRLLKSQEESEQIYEKRILPEKMAINLKSQMEFCVWNDLKTMIMTVFRVL